MHHVKTQCIFTGIYGTIILIKNGDFIMSEALFNRASKNFDKYLKDFQQEGTVYMLPAERLTREEWKKLNESLVQYGVHMVPQERKGIKYMKFGVLPKRRGMTTHAAQADNDLGAKLKRYTGLEWEHKTAESSGLGYEHYRIRIDDLSQAQVQSMLDTLDRNGIYDANNVSTNKGQFLIVKAPDKILDSVLDYYATVSYNGVPAYIYVRPGMGRGAAMGRVEKIVSHGEHYAVALNKEGHTGADYIVVAIKKSDAEKIGAKHQDGVLSLSRDNATQMQKLKSIIGKTLTQIKGNPVTIDSIADFGAYSNRAILLVSVGNKKLPFYISTGSTGKTDVPTGKWEFFGGIDRDDWFRKGDLEDILTHYKSPELKQIADALNDQVGDLHDTIDVLKTIGRCYLGGKGDVSYTVNAPEISRERINHSVFDFKNDGVFMLDLHDIKQYLSGLKPIPTKNVTSEQTQNAEEYKKGATGLKAKMLARLGKFFPDYNKNDK